MRPGWRDSRSSGPDTETAAITLPLGERTGADTEATPCSRSPMDWAQPRRRIPDSAVAENAAFCRPRWIRSGSSHASRIWAADPARMVSCEPTGIVSRRPLGRSAAATHTRCSPCRRHSCADSPVMSRSLARTGPAAARRRSSPAAAASSARRGPSTNRPCMSRATRRWCSSATASRWAVGRARPVPATRPARVAGPDSRAASTRAALSRTPTPLELSIYQYCRLRSWDARVRFPHTGIRGRVDGDLALEGSSAVGKTLAEKVWDEHVVRTADGEPDLLYIDLHLIHEVTSPQAFDGLRLAGRPVRRPDLTLATEDHNVPTLDWDKPIADPVSRTQVETLRRNAEEFGVRLHPLGDVEQGIVHVVGPQLGLTQPGMTIVCGDSHTSTHGAFGAIAFGIGTSEVEHVLATQTLPQARPQTMAV